MIAAMPDGMARMRGGRTLRNSVRCKGSGGEGAQENLEAAVKSQTTISASASSSVPPPPPPPPPKEVALKAEFDFPTKQAWVVDEKGKRLYSKDFVQLAPARGAQSPVGARF
jgi:hypothetical protein